MGNLADGSYASKRLARPRRRDGKAGPVRGLEHIGACPDPVGVLTPTMLLSRAHFHPISTKMLQIIATRR
jgi:hypothetical protein